MEGLQGFLLYFAIFVAAVLLLVAVNANRRASRAAIGAKSERDTVKALKKSGISGDVYLGLLLGGGGDVDIVFVDQNNRVSVGEVKTVFGTVTARGTTLLSNGKPLTTQPVPQVRRQVDALRRLGIAAKPFVVASHGHIPNGSLRCDGVPVVTADSLPQHLRRSRAPQNSHAAAALTSYMTKQQKKRKKGT